MTPDAGVPLSHNVVPTIHRAYRAAALAATVVTLCCALVAGHATNITAANFMVNLVNTVIGIGGRGDPISANIPAKLNGTVVPPGYSYDGIDYPASLQLSASTNISAPLVYSAISALTSGQIIVAGYSEGTLAAEKVKRQLQASNSAPDASRLSFVEIASPFAANGGIFARFPGVSVPFIVNNMGSAQATNYDTTYVINEYDPYADFPAYFNPVALLNTLLGVFYAHPDVNYDSVVLGTTPSVTTTVVNSAGGTDTYVFVYNRNLPLLAPLRDLASATRLTPLVKPVLDAIEPLLDVVINMAYTDRENLHPAAFTPFSLFTPIPKLIGALTQVPGALGQGLKNFVTDIKAEIKSLQTRLQALATKLKSLAATAKKTDGTATTPAAASAAPVAAAREASSSTSDVASPIASKANKDKQDRKAAKKATARQRVDSDKTTTRADESSTPATGTASDEPKALAHKRTGHKSSGSTASTTTAADGKASPRKPTKARHDSGHHSGHTASHTAAGKAAA